MEELSVNWWDLFVEAIILRAIAAQQAPAGDGRPRARARASPKGGAMAIWDNA
jgi:hypothetical protein